MKSWDKMTFEEIGQLNRKNTLVIFPIASCEQHGQRLSVDTDAFLAAHWTMEAVREIPNSVVLPVQRYGMSYHHTKFSGTISLSPSTTTNIVCDILWSLLGHGFENILILNSHGGNHKPIEVAIQMTEQKWPKANISNPLFKIINDNNIVEVLSSFGENFVHAGAAEVSIVAAVDPQKIRPSEVVDDIPKGASFGQGVDSPEEWMKRFPKGQKGDQTNVRAEAGKILNKLIVRKLIEEAKKMME